jgi:hypothetical protein
VLQQLNPPIPLFVPGRGTGLAHAVIDYGPEHDLIWVIFLDNGGEIWALKNSEVRAQINVSMGRHIELDVVGDDG